MSYADHFIILSPTKRLKVCLNESLFKIHFRLISLVHDSFDLDQFCVRIVKHVVLVAESQLEFQCCIIFNYYLIESRRKCSIFQLDSISKMVETNCRSIRLHPKLVLADKLVIFQSEKSLLEKCSYSIFNKKDYGFSALIFSPFS